MTKDIIERLDLKFDDNHLVPLLYGEQNVHLSILEDRLGVDIASRGNQLVISGTAEKLELARIALNSLWKRLRKDLPVGEAEIDAVVRLADGNTDKSTRDLALSAFEQPEKNKIKTRHSPISARTPVQAAYLEAMEKSEMVFGLGPAGTGKTWLAVAKAVAMLQSGAVDRIILCRPAVEAGERLGFLPGDMQEKVNPYLRPIFDALHEMMTAEQVVKRLAQNEIEIAPLAFMRGRTLSNAFVILDEAQNTTSEQMKMALTRLGENSRMVITGDPSQIDLPKNITSGLKEAERILNGVEGISFVRFTEKDVVRHRLVSRIVGAYDAHEKQKNGAATRND